LQIGNYLASPIDRDLPAIGKKGEIVSSVPDRVAINEAVELLNATVRTKDTDLSMGVLRR